MTEIFEKRPLLPKGRLGVELNLFCPEKPGHVGKSCPALRGLEIDGSALEFCV